MNTLKKYKNIVAASLLVTLFLTFISFSCVREVFADDTIVSADGLYTYIKNDDNTIQLQSYEGDERNLVIPSKVDGFTVKRLRCNAFIEFDSLTLPDSITNIPAQMLSGCKAKQIILGKNTTQIQTQAFWNCSNLTEIVLPDCLRAIDGQAFRNCTKLVSINLPKNVSSISFTSGSAFPGCKNLQSINVDPLNEKYMTIEGVLFEKHENGMPKRLLAYPAGSSFTTYVVPDGVEEIARDAFETAKVVKVVLPSSIKTIGSGSFCDCTSLEVVQGGENLERIEGDAFHGCISLAEFEIPSTVTFIGYRAFYATEKYEPNYPSDLINNESGDYIIGTKLKIKGEKKYSNAEECFDLINKERTQAGLPKLVIDSTLTENAMQRAAECAVYFEHIRPDGTRFSTIDANANGEILSAGRSGAAMTVKGWMDSSMHRSNILKNDFVSIGVGCFTCDGVTYWAALFSYNNPNVTYNRKGNSEWSICEIQLNTTFTEIKPYIYPKNKLEVYPGQEYSLLVKNENAGWNNHYCTFENDGITWKSSDDSIASVDEYGRITANKEGSVTITAYVNRAIVLTREIACVKKADTTPSDSDDESDLIDISKTNARLIKSSFVFSGKTKKSQVAIEGLTKNVDYTVSFNTNCRNVGMHKIVVKGTGRYNGVKTFNIKIKPKGTSISTIKSEKNGFKLTWKKQSLKMASSHISGYQIRYSTSSNMVGYKKKDCAGYKVTSRKVSKLKAHKKYYVKIRTYKTINGKRYYSAWSTKKTVMTK